MTAQGRQFERVLGKQTAVDPGLQQEIFQAYIGRTDKVVVVHDANFLVRLINQHGQEVLGVTQGEAVGEMWVKRFVMEDEQERMTGELKQLLEPRFPGPLKNEVSLRTKEGGVPFSWQHFAVWGASGRLEALLSVGEDVSLQTQTSGMLKRRNAILQALSLASEYFLFATPNVWEAHVLKVLGALGNARGSERVYVCKNREGNGDGPALSLKYEWKANGPARVFEGEATPQYSYAQVGLKRWADVLSKHGVIYDELSQLAPEERQWNTAPEAQSLVVVPIFVDMEWWGYLGFEDWEEGRECSAEEMEALKAVATIFGAAIKRKRTEEELEEEKASVEKRVEDRTKELTKASEAVEQAMYSIKQEKARLTASIHSLSLAFLLTDLQGTLLLFNHAVNDILGKSEEGWTSDLIQAKLNGIVDFKDLVHTCVTKAEEIKLTDLKYGEKYLRLYLTPIKLLEEGGVVIGAVVLIEDVTEAKKIQLSRDEFFAVAAHELRTPLSAISGNASIILDYFVHDLGKPDLAEMVKDILNSSNRLVAIVNEYLDISRLELNKLEIKKEKFDVVLEARAVVEELNETARQKGLKLNLEVADKWEGWVHADRERTRQALINLVGNAIKYTKEGGVYVKIEPSEKAIQVSVYDTGLGIPQEEQPFLFQKFRKLGERVYSRDVNEGTGMGLYITRLLTEAMGAKVYLGKSEVGKGSAFVLEIPQG